MAAGEIDNPERPVREQLKKASLDHGSTAIGSGSEESATKASQSLSRKRSHEAIDDESVKEQNGTVAAVERAHTRKRSRDSTAEDDEIEVPKKRSSSELGREVAITSSSRAATPEAQPGEIMKESSDDIASPKNKRSRLQDLAATQTLGTTDKKPAGSGFANTSATSPFGTVADNSKDQPQTSASAFAASKFSSLSNGPSAFSTAPRAGGFSSFGASKTPSAEVSSDKKDDSSTKSVFGGSLGAKSAFSAPSSGAQNGFGGFKSASSGSVFGGSAFGSVNNKEGLTSFKSAQPAGVQKATKAFGAAADDDDDDDDDKAEDKDESGIKSPLPVGADQDRKDERFYEQEVETGEEDEEVIFSGRAKLYTFMADESGNKVWKERGLGVLKLNVKRAFDDGLTQSSTEDSAVARSPTARFLMRADGSHRVVLNTAVTKTLTDTITGKGPPVHSTFLFTGTIAGASEPQTLQLKMKQQLAMELYEKVLELQQML